MLLEVKVRLISPVLGGLRPDHSGVRRFKRINGKLLTSQFRLEESLTLASSNLQLKSAESFVRMEHAMQPPTIVLYERRFRAHGIHQIEHFEALRKGTVITFKVMLRDDLDGCPSLAQVSEMFSLVGEFSGMSPFGGKFGMGKFGLESLTAACPAAAEVGLENEARKCG